MESTLRAAAGAPDLKLIETMGWDGTAFARVDLHLARLARSAALLGWPCQGAATALRSAAPPHAARMRLTLDRDGSIDVTHSALPATALVWRVALSTQQLNSADPWLTVKSSNRAAYDTARATMPTGLHEVILQNERGEVCDGTITTLFFDSGDGMRTPPLTSGVLPGVLRAEISVPEQVLMVRDLPEVRLWVGNSLRGLLPAVWAAQA